MITHEFEPVFDKDSKILILGTFPSVKSREQGFYYSHPQNRFWQVLATVFEEAVPKTMDEKKEFLFQHKIAVWDVIHSCDIIGSSDTSIKNVVPNKIEEVIQKSNIQHIYTNGKTAGKLYCKYMKKSITLPMTELPSTSPANAVYSKERLCEIWKQVKEETK